MKLSSHIKKRLLKIVLIISFIVILAFEIIVIHAIIVTKQGGMYDEYERNLRLISISTLALIVNVIALLRIFLDNRTEHCVNRDSQKNGRKDHTIFRLLNSILTITLIFFLWYFVKGILKLYVCHNENFDDSLSVWLLNKYILRAMIFAEASFLNIYILLGKRFRSHYLRLIKRRVHVIKKALVEAKIFSDTIIAIIIAVIGINVSITANKISKLQTEIIEKQAEIDYQSNLPLIDLEINYNKEENINALSVRNLGGALYWYHYEIIPIVEYSYNTGVLKSKEDKIVEIENVEENQSVRIPVCLYYEGSPLFYDRQFHTTDGLLFEVYDSDWHEILYSASTQMVSTRQKNNDGASLVYSAPAFSQNHDNTVTICTGLSWGYILRIEYCSKLDAADGLDENEILDKSYLVLTGEGNPHGGVYVNDTENAASIVQKYRSEHSYNEGVFLTGDSLKDAQTLDYIFAENWEKYLLFSLHNF